MRVVATVTSKGQVTVPKRVRQTLGLSQGDGLEFTLQRGRVMLRAVRPRRTSSGVLHRLLPRGWHAPRVEEMDRAVGQHLARKHARRP